MVTLRDLWGDRLQSLQRDIARVRALVATSIRPYEPVLAARLDRRLQEHTSELDRLRSRSGTAAPDWKCLAAAHQRCHALFDEHLQLLGGLAISHGASAGDAGWDDGFTRVAGVWVEALRQRAELPDEIAVIAGERPRLDRRMLVIRSPFLGWDLWELPLLARGLGELLAANQSSAPHFTDAISPILNFALDLTGDKAAAQRFMSHLHADMLATALVGPVYPIARVVLELNCGAPDHQYGSQACGTLDLSLEAKIRPSASQQLAAMLTTLQLMDTPDVDDVLAYARVIEVINTIWAEALPSDGPPSSLASVQVNLAAGFRSLFDAGVRPALGGWFKTLERSWRRTSAWRNGWELRRTQGVLSFDALPDAITQLLGAIWLARLTNLDSPDSLLSWAKRQIADPNAPFAEMRSRPQSARLNLGKPHARSPRAGLVIDARIERMDRRWRRLQAVVSDLRLPVDVRTAVRGRFLQQLSPQVVALETAAQFAARQHATCDSWAKLNAVEQEARPLLDEALAFLGSQLVRDREADCEPAHISGSKTGPSICALAERLMARLAERTGVNWTGRAILGADPLLDLGTDLVRVRFPEWSPLGLPILGHEFGHLAARVTPELARYQAGETVAATHGVEKDKRAGVAREVQDHLAELFADVFATYALGPAFACAAILFEFNAGFANALRGGHPSHDDRATVILRSLARLGEQAADETGANPFAEVVDAVGGLWSAATGLHKGTSPFGVSLRPREEVLRWEHELSAMVDRRFRLGIAYSVERWSWARHASLRMAQLPLPTAAELRHGFSGEGLDELWLEDVLNLSWWTWLRRVQSWQDLTNFLVRLSREAFETGM